MNNADDLSVALTEQLLRLHQATAQQEVLNAHRQREEAQRRLADDLAIESIRKDHFLASLSHELRTPLTPVLLVLESLEEQRLTLPSQLVSDVLLAKSSLLHEVKLIVMIYWTCFGSQRCTPSRLYLLLFSLSLIPYQRCRSITIEYNRCRLINICLNRER